MGIYDNENDQSNELVRMASMNSDTLLRGGDLNVDDLDTHDLDAFFDEWNTINHGTNASSSTATSLPSIASSDRVTSSHNNSAFASSHSSSPQPEPQLDISAVLEKLSPELKTRFVDQLADQLGKQLTATAHSAKIHQQQLQQQQPQILPMQFYPGYGYDNQLPPSYPHHHPTAVYGVYDNSKYAGGFPSTLSQGFPVQERSILTSGGSLRTTSSSENIQVKSNSIAAPSLAGEVGRIGVSIESQQQSQPPSQGINNLALPLVSAALSAFVLTSMNSLGAQQQLQTGGSHSEN